MCVTMIGYKIYKIYLNVTSPDTGVKTPSSNLSSPEDLSSKFGSENEMGAGVQI